MNKYCIGLFVVAALLFIAVDGKINIKKFDNIENDIINSTKAELSNNNENDILTLTVIGNNYSKKYTCKAKSVINECEILLPNLEAQIEGFIGYSDDLLSNEVNINPGSYILKGNDTIYLITSE